MKFAVVFVTCFFVPNLFGQQLIDFSTSSCSEHSYPEFIKRRVISKELEKEILTVRLGLVLNCCLEPDVRLNYMNDSLFIQIQNISSTVCGCECCFEITIRATGIPNTDFTVIYEKESLHFGDYLETIYVPYILYEHPSKYAFPTYDELKAFEKDTGEMNLVAENDQRVGLWRIMGDTKNYLSKYRIDERGISKCEWSASYDIDGELLEVCGWDGMSEFSCAEKRDYYKLFGIDVNTD